MGFNVKIITMRTQSILFAIAAFLSFSFASAQDISDFMSPKGKVDAAKVPASYDFSWKYTMDIKSGTSKNMIADYLLAPGAAYFGMSLPQGMLMIMDTKNQLAVTAFSQGGKKMASASKLPDYTEMSGKKDLGKFTYKTLPAKTILGYKCKGVEATNADYVMIFYYTNDAPVSFADMFKSAQSMKVPDPFSSYFKPGEKPLMLSVDITEKAKNRTTSMTCIALEKNATAFKKADYKFM